MIAEKEAAIAFREKQLFAEEQKRLESVDSMRKELFKDVQEMRRRSDESIEREKMLIDERLKRLEEEKVKKQDLKFLFKIIQLNISISKMCRCHSLQKILKI